MTTTPKDKLFGIRFLDAIAEWMDENLTPEDVFSEESLTDWARENDYTLERTQSNPWRELWEQWFEQDEPSPWYHDLEQDVEFCVGCGNNREYGHDSSCVIARAKALLEQSKESER